MAGYTNRDQLLLKQIQDLDPASAVADTDVVAIQQAGITRKATVTQVKANIASVSVPLTAIGAVNGVASLDASGDVPDAQIAPNITRNSDLTAGLALKLNTGGFLTNNGSSLLFNSGGNTYLGISNQGVLSFNIGGNTSQQVQLQGALVNNNTEFALSAPILQCSAGRFDLLPGSGKAEFRVAGAATLFNVYNTTNQQFLLSINSSNQSVDTFGEFRVNSGGSVVAKIATDGTLYKGANAYALLSQVTPSQVGNGTAQWNANRLQGASITLSSLATNQILNFDGTNWVNTSSPTFSSLGLTTPLAMSAGGTGANGSAGAKSNLGVLGSKYSARSSAYTIVWGDAGTTFDCSASAGAFTITLPQSSTSATFVCAIRKVDSSSNAVTIAVNTGDTINGAATYVLNAQYQSVTLFNNGNGSWTIGGQSLANLNPATAQYNASQLQSASISSTTPTDGAALVYRSGNWAPQVGKQILQVITTNISGSFSTTSTNYTSWGVSASITPKSTSSQILVMITLNGLRKTGTGNFIRSIVNRTISGTTGQIAKIADGLGFTGATDSLEQYTAASLTFADSPGVTSSVTYDVPVSSGVNGLTVVANQNSTNSSITLIELL